ncbi:MAG: co-chaperone GroES [Bdellovibrio sp.]|nr:co-chaperone GroES [Bdellovibrio sp.]
MKGLVVAKKKASAKKANVKKVAKKTVSKKSPKKVNKKSAPVKKSAAKKSSAKKTTVKKTAVKKAAIKKTPVKKTPSHLVKAAPAVKKIDLSNFVTPLDDRLIVQLSGTEKMTPGGLYIPDTVADTSGNLEGFVVAVGRGHMGKKGQVRPMDVQVGDRVVFSEYAGSKIKIQNEDLIILREGDVMGVVSK